LPEVVILQVLGVHTVWKLRYNLWNETFLGSVHNKAGGGGAWVGREIWDSHSDVDEGSSVLRGVLCHHGQHPRRLDSEHMMVI